VDTDGGGLKAVQFCSTIESSKIVLSQLSKELRVDETEYFRNNKPATSILCEF